MKLKTILAVICLFIFISPLYALKTGRADELETGIPKAASISLNEDFGVPSKTFSFRVPKNAYAIRLAISDAEADLDLFINHGSRPDIHSASDYSSEVDDYNESLFITRQSEQPLESGIYYVTVAYQLDYLPMVDGKRIEEVAFSLTYDVVVAEPEVFLEPGVPEELELLPERGMFSVAAVDIPAGTDVFRIDVFNTDADIDIFTSIKNAAKSREEALYVSESMLGSESLIISGYPDSRLLTGRYYISFIDQLAKELPQKLSVIVTLGEDAPKEVTAVPRMPEPEDSFESALLSTVEIISENGKGSGCVVSRTGLIVTNLHVVRGADGKPADDIFAAVSLSEYKPPVELFSASIVDYIEELDLALLQVSAGRYGQPLSFGYEFPYFRLGDSSMLRIGQPLGILGYPEVGGTGSRTSVTFTSGIVSGFEAATGCNLVKTDAMISSGNSGGAVINAYYELLGIPGYIMDINNDKMGYIYPVSCFPEEWIDMIDEANRM